MARMRRKSKEGWMRSNQKLIERRIDEVGNNSLARLLNVLDTVAQDVMEYIDSQKVIPIYTGNLKDATGIGVYRNGVLKRYVPSQIATRPQSSGFHHKNVYDIWGHQYLSDALEAASKEGYGKGIWIILFSAVPYAFYIEDRDAFFSDIKDVMLNAIISELM